MLRKSELYAIDFPIAVGPLDRLVARLRTGAAFETEDNSGKDFFIRIGRNPLKSPDSEK
jgi:hypothetical protein